MKRVLIATTLLIIALLLAAPLPGYVNGISRSDTGTVVRHKWKPGAFPIMWRMNPVQAANITGTRTQTEVFAASFAAWQGVSTATITFQQGSDTAASTQPNLNDNVNLVTTNTTTLPPGFELPPGVLALTVAAVYTGTGFDPTANRTIDFAGQIAEADIYFNSTVPFTTNTTAVADRIDLQSVATHEIGHFLGLDHSPLISATMFWSVGPGFIYPRNISSDDAAGVSILYPSSSFSAKGKISGTVRTTSNTNVYAAIVVAVNSNGQPAGSAITDDKGAYTIEGLDAGSYSVYAEPLDGPITLSNVTSFLDVFRGLTANTSFTTRFR